MATVEPAVRDVLARMDGAWAVFDDRVQSMAGERFGDRIGERGWTRKQMLAHIGTWHELTTERLAAFLGSGAPSELAEEADTINARAARAAAGRTSGEVLQGMEDSYQRLRREVGRLTDAQLAMHGGWAEAIVAGNTHEHYAEHLPDLDVT